VFVVVSSVTVNVVASVAVVALPVKAPLNVTVVNVFVVALYVKSPSDNVACAPV